MSVRRHAARMGLVGAVLGGLLIVASSPASADGDRVAVRSASSFTVGGSPGGVAVEVRKRTDGCVMLRTALALRLDGVRPEQVRVQVNSDGRWWPVPVSGGSGAVATARTSPAEPTLCKGKGRTVRYRVAFLAGVADGRLTVIGEATTAAGRLIGRASTAARVVGGAKAPSPTPSRKPSPTPTPSAEVTEPSAEDTGSAVAALGPTAGAPSAAADSSSGGSPIMWFGILLVLVGAGLIALLIRRNRAEKAGEGDAYPQVPLPRATGGTTYRSGGPVAPVYGQQPPTPTVYGGSATPRATGNVYGAPAAGDQPGGEPPAAGPDATTVLPRPPR
ncbi:MULTISPECIES: hypothetical protein [Micromonospora]|uniref:Uncharacterized protein n=1 Tax=Micromonospora solifontis TaxID=2487138 RepID=A0ABX9WHA5_9ACTN|nr:MULTISPECIES: hypothetical protein [Micromonospora]NES15269.1 hypothetical protein [Micromonospora sp. PPF5-17B]NES36541.1 hypothetical protein [Micromonospora solifontis]NES56315.1 hypothetical protein [Micromonospora sp. PPF5-6]RNL99428.1 hypothetical protein EFE23_10270 [Micromonospora solifontis]